MVHLYCPVVQAGFYSDVIVLDFRSKGARFDPRPGHVAFFKESVTLV